MIKKITAFLIVLCLTLPLISCGVRINTDYIELTVGELVDLTEYVSGNFTVTSDSDKVDVIAGTVLYGRTPGDTALTIKSGFSQRILNAHVSYAPVELDIMGDLYKTEKNSILELNADFGLNADRTTDVSWLVNGKRAGVGKKFEYRLADFGVYEIKAVAGGKTVTVEASCFEPPDSQPTIRVDGESFTAGDEIAFFAPSGAVRWFICGEPVGSGSEFTTALPSGDYTVFALVNGVQSNSIDFSVYGAPHDLKCDFDSDYPNITLSWEGASTDYTVRIGGKSYPVNGKRFDLSGIVDTDKSVSVSVKAAGFGEATIQTPVLTSADIDYIRRYYPGGNYYMTSDDEVYSVVEHAMVFREKGKDIELSLKMGYDSELTPALLLSKAWLTTEQTGVYRLSAKGSSSVGGTLMFKIECITYNSPTNFDTSLKAKFTSLTSPSFGGGVSSLPVDGWEKCEVSSSEQLFYAVSKGYCPLPSESIEPLYRTARTVLLDILDERMDEEQKVRAIFDWVMWSTSYDFETAKETSVYISVDQPAHYLEGVFTTGFAVCDGIAKSVCLLCNMAGIACERVVGFAFQGGQMVRHAWNKVRIDGMWYLLDATWSDAVISVGDKTYESGLHNYYLLSDGEASDHVAAYPEIDRKAYISYDFYRKNGMNIASSNFDSLDYCIKRGLENAIYEVKIGEAVVEREYYCIELKLDRSVENFYTINHKQFLSALRKINGYYTHSLTDGLLLIIVKKV